MIAALFVQTGGCYFGVPEVDPWDKERDAMRYHGPHAVVAHPPCERWGRYWYGGPMLHKMGRRKTLGDDGGCFASALASVTLLGGVLEHPEASHAWPTFGIPKPPHTGGRIPVLSLRTALNVWTCCVEQGHYGHRARKKTWLLFVGREMPMDLIWGPSSASARLDQGFHSKEERNAAQHLPRAQGETRMGRDECAATPIPFRDLLISLARSAV